MSKKLKQISAAYLERLAFQQLVLRGYVHGGIGPLNSGRPDPYNGIDVRLEVFSCLKGHGGPFLCEVIYNAMDGMMFTPDFGAIFCSGNSVKSAFRNIPRRWSKDYGWGRAIPALITTDIGVSDHEFESVPLTSYFIGVHLGRFVELLRIQIQNRNQANGSRVEISLLHSVLHRLDKLIANQCLTNRNIL